MVHFPLPWACCRRVRDSPKFTLRLGKAMKFADHFPSGKPLVFQILCIFYVYSIYIYHNVSLHWAKFIINDCTSESKLFSWHLCAREAIHGSPEGFAGCTGVAARAKACDLADGLESRHFLDCPSKKKHCSCWLDNVRHDKHSDFKWKWNESDRFKNAFLYVFKIVTWNPRPVWSSHPYSTFPHAANVLSFTPVL